ncbi:hypothetical protein QVD17_21016 [Tagetes erecta]|uniref:AP2/ERF domain-containing protein n=1 Tax=Tagetes erecta TaxID=13708 RepID=A0AAD8KQY0_TARER|nr:hypothetical protein QVD17_21016 [Tagetes erecta]
MDSNDNIEREQQQQQQQQEPKSKSKSKSRDELTLIYTYNADTKNPEETETTNFSTKSTTKRYKCVWRKNGRYIARIRNPFTNSRIFLGKFASNEAAVSAYFAKKTEFESQIRAQTVSNNSVMIDNHGFLLGDFSRLDDDLRICD